MAMEQERANNAQPKSALSPSLSDFLGLIRSTNNPSRSTSSVVDNTRPSALHTKAFVADWLSDTIKSTSHTKAPTTVIHELARVSDQLNLSRQETEEWMPLLISLCNLTNSCLGVVRGLTQSALIAFVKDQTSILLATVILETGTRVFRHLDRTQVKRARSEGYMTWNQRTLEMTKSFMEFMEHILQTNSVKEHASDMIVAVVCNMLLRYAEDARSEYIYLNLTFKSIVLLVPNCAEDRGIRFEKAAVVKLLCDGVHGTIMDIYRTCVDNTGAEVIEGFFKRRWTLARFYMSHFKALVNSLFKDICSTKDEAIACRRLLRYLLYFLRGRVCSNEVIRRRHPEIQQELMKFVNVVEEVIIGGIFASSAALDEEKCAVIQEFSVSTGPRAISEYSDALTEQEWILGRLYFLLKTVTLFDEFSTWLQLQLYPIERVSTYSSPLTRIIESIRSLDLQEFLPLAGQDPDHDSGDIYIRALTDLVTFAHLIQPRQFAKLQIDMIGLVLEPNELLSLLAIDWWTCISTRFGQNFASSQVMVLTELLSTLPIGRSSQKVRLLLCSLLPQLDGPLQITVTSHLLSLLDRMADNEQSTLLSCFPYECLSESSLTQVVARCVDGWQNACSLLSDEKLVLEAFYTLPQNVACLSSIYSNPILRAGLPTDLRMTLIGWSTEIISGVNELLFLVQNDQHALNKISCTVDAVVDFLGSTAPLQCEEMIQILNAFSSWTKLPESKLPMSKLLMARFLVSCSSVEISEGPQMDRMVTLLTGLYDFLLREDDWTIVHDTLNTLLSQRCTPVPARHLVQNIQEMECSDMVPTDDCRDFWVSLRGRMKRFDSPTFGVMAKSILFLQVG
ncbi:hypothetical protein FBU30_002390 [Linnemannia zychae]|nr:hypothetical protein FBU30_002390 [Linnemannia zychae]